MNIIKLYFAQIFIDDIYNFFERNNFSYFKPHENKSVEDSLQYAKLDSYYGIFHDGFMIAYGMLRGLDEGYETPMLGIGIDKSYQKKGIGKLFMNFLELEAKLSGYNKMYLRVHEDNTQAKEFYDRLNYSSLGYKDKYLVLEKEL